MDKFFLLLGSVGSIILLMGGIPQIFHLLKVKDSTGQSLLGWCVWIAGGAMILAYAIYKKDPIFIFLQLAGGIIALITVSLIIKFRRT